MIFIIKLIILLICVSSIQSDCDVCQTNSVACHNENEYCLCVNGKPTGDFIKCPKGYVCTPNTYVCYPPDKVKPSCFQGMTKNNSATDNLPVLDPLNEHATEKKDSANTSIAVILSAENTTTTAATTNKSARTEFTTTTMKLNTPSVPGDPQSICRDAGSPGIFYANDPTCSTIVVCFALKGTLIGLRRSCPNGQYFGPGAKYCSIKKPDMCA